MVVVYSIEEKSVSVEIERSLVDTHPGLKSALKEAVRKWKADHDTNDPVNENDEMDDDKDEVG